MARWSQFYLGGCQHSWSTNSGKTHWQKMGDFYLIAASLCRAWLNVLSEDSHRELELCVEIVNSLPICSLCVRSGVDYCPQWIMWNQSSGESPQLGCDPYYAKCSNGWVKNRLTWSKHGGKIMHVWGQLIIDTIFTQASSSPINFLSPHEHG